MSDENNENQEDSFPLEKILTMSAKDYCNMYSKKIKDYTAVGVHLTLDKHYDGRLGLIESFLKKIPENTEVIVDFQHSVGGGETSDYYNFWQYSSGVALIPKEKKDQE